MHKSIITKMDPKEFRAKYGTINVIRAGLEVAATTEIFHEDYDPATGMFALEIGLYVPRTSTGGNVSLAVMGMREGRPVARQVADYMLTQRDFEAAIRGEVIQIDHELFLGSTDHKTIDGMPVKVHTKTAGERTGKLQATVVRAGNIVTVKAIYDASPFVDEPKPKSFFLNQRELDDYMLYPNRALEEKKA